VSVAPDDIRELFSVFGPVEVRPMFGGAGIYAEGRMFALVSDGVIYLKADYGQRGVARSREASNRLLCAGFGANLSQRWKHKRSGGAGPSLPRRFPPGG
jgi:hypothetical protein